jgi:hypothetical protein
MLLPELNLFYVVVQTVILRVLMHCEGCANAVKRACARIPGMETIDALDSVMDIFLNQPCMSGLDHIVAILSWLMALPETQALLILIKA